MKTFKLSIVLLLFSMTGFAQSNDFSKHQIAVHYGTFGGNELYQLQDIVGAGSYDSDRFFTIGLSYTYRINHWLGLSSGIEYGNHNVIFKPPFTGGEPPQPKQQSFSVVNIPLTAQVDFWKYVFVNGGALISIDAQKNEEIGSLSGLGFVLGAGLKYDFSFGATVFVNPYLKMQNLLSFEDKDFSYSLAESGVKIGMAYNF